MSGPSPCGPLYRLIVADHFQGIQEAVREFYECSLGDDLKEEAAKPARR